jgi:hypothetical protein
VGRIYDLEEAVRTAHFGMTGRAARGEPFLSGLFTRGEVVYAVRDLLDELASEMGQTLEQEEIHIAYGDRTWTLTVELQPDR